VKHQDLCTDFTKDVNFILSCKRNRCIFLTVLYELLGGNRDSRGRWITACRGERPGFKATYLSNSD